MDNGKPTSLQRFEKRAAVQVAETEVKPVDPFSSTWLEHRRELESEIQDSTILFPGSDAYEDAVFIGNLLYRMQTPSAVVQVRSIRGVQGTVNFARKYNLKLTVKNGGHSYAGFCLNREGIVMDLREMCEVKLDEDAMTVTLQAGATWKNAYELLNTKETWDNIIIGGQCPNVGVSGFTLGGGLSPFSRSYGLGVDNVLEMTVVTADGEAITVSRDSQNPDQDEHKKDLFWALCGGGGGNFGVIVEFKSRIHKLRDKFKDTDKPNQTFGRVCCGELGWDLPEQEEDFKAMMRTFNARKIPEELTVDAYCHYEETQLKGWMTVIFNGPEEECENALAPLLAYNPSFNTVKEMQWTEWAQYSEGFDKKSLVYHHHTSFIFPEGGITKEVTEKILQLMYEAGEILKSHTDPSLPLLPHGEKPFLSPPKSSVHILWDHIGGATARVGAQDTAFYWRDGHYVATVKVQWTQESQARQMYEFAEKCKRELGAYAIERKAAYVNYIDDTVENWQEAYYGKNYARLLRVKKHWDPDQFWSFDMAIGEEIKVSRREKVSATMVNMSMMSPTPEFHVPRRWTEVAVRNPERLSSAKSSEELLSAQANMRRKSLLWS